MNRPAALTVPQNATALSVLQGEIKTSNTPDQTSVDKSKLVNAVEVPVPADANALKLANTPETDLASKAVPQPSQAVVDHSNAVTAVGDAINVWALAWSEQDIQGYLSAYAKSFTPADGGSLEKWAGKRAATIKRAKHIRLSIDDLGITLQDPQHATAEFKQTYRASYRKNKARKTLKLEQIEGRWLIVRESSTNLTSR
jgi:ketosteroid isomerase-like protein